MNLRVSFFALSVGLVGCSDPVQVGARPAPVGAPTVGAPQAAPDASTGSVDAGVDAGPRVYTDEDFVELDVVHRDPFRDYILALAVQTPTTSDVVVKMRNVSLDQMRLIAVVTGVPVPYAMIVDPEGVGHVVVRGDHIGRPEVVNSGGSDGLPIALYWTIDRIRPNEVVLTRADPLHPDQPPLMRSLLLRDTSAGDDYSVGTVGGQLGNTGDNASAPAPDAPAPSPAPAAAPGSSRDRESGATISPAPAPSPPSNSGSTGSGSRFGGVFAPRR